MYDMTPSYVWHDPSIWDMTPSYVMNLHDECFICLLHMHTRRLFVESWNVLRHVWISTMYVWHDLFIRAWLLHRHVIATTYVWHGSFICVTWLWVEMCDVTLHNRVLYTRRLGKTWVRGFRQIRIWIVTKFKKLVQIFNFLSGSRLPDIPIVGGN